MNRQNLRSKRKLNRNKNLSKATFKVTKRTVPFEMRGWGGVWGIHPEAYQKPTQDFNFLPAKHQPMTSSTVSDPSYTNNARQRLQLPIKHGNKCTFIGLRSLNSLALSNTSIPRRDISNHFHSPRVPLPTEHNVEGDLAGLVGLPDWRTTSVHVKIYQFVQ